MSSSRSRGTTETMERVTLRVPSDQLSRVERLVEAGEYPNRSEAIRQFISEGLTDD